MLLEHEHCSGSQTGMLETCPGAGPRRSPVGLMSERLVCRSRAGKRQGHRTVQVTHATPGSQGVPMGQCAVLEAMAVAYRAGTDWVPVGGVRK